MRVFKKCGHPKTPENCVVKYNEIRGDRHPYMGCKTCKRERALRYYNMRKQYGKLPSKDTRCVLSDTWK